MNTAEDLNLKNCHRKCHLHLVVIGHVDAGKSTLMGHLLFNTGNVSDRTMHKYEQESKRTGKQSFMFAWIFDETHEERSRGITMDTSQFQIETTTKFITLIDTPGHKDFIPSMISGATQADAALLVVDASYGEFETGFDSGGQTREHALVIRSLGVHQLVVVINKLDTVNWSQSRYNEIIIKLSTFLKLVGFKDSELKYVPCSGLTGENLTKAATLPEFKNWYTGDHLLNILDTLLLVDSIIDKPFRLPIKDIFKSNGSGLSISGRIQSGKVAVNDKIIIGPKREQALVKSLNIVSSSPTLQAVAGDYVIVTLSGIENNNICNGFIVCHPENPIPVASCLQAKVVVFSIKIPITMGFPVLLHHQSLVEPAVITKLLAKFHKNNGSILKKNPRCLESQTCALIEIVTNRPISVELYSDFKKLGRLLIRLNGSTIAAGVVTNIKNDSSK